MEKINRNFFWGGSFMEFRFEPAPIFLGSPLGHVEEFLFIC